jgi:hypothetical protein
VGLGSATTLNMIDMIGVGLFITLPLIVGAMGGPQAMLAGYWAPCWQSAMGLYGRNWVLRCLVPAVRIDI